VPSILFTTSTLPRWPRDPEARFVLDLARALPPDWESLILAPLAPGARARESLEGIDVVRYRYAPAARLETLCYPGSTLGQVQQNPLRLALVPGLLAGLRRAVADQLRRRSFDCVHAHWLFPQGLVHTLGFARARHPPLVVTSHGGDLGLAGRLPLARGLLRAVVRRAQSITVVAPGMREQLARLDKRLDPTEAAVIPMGVDLDRFRPDHRDPAWPRRHGLRPPVVLFVGRLVEKKGLPTLLEAFARQTRPATLAICGEGPQEARLRRQADQLGIASRVRFLGSLDHRELPVAYASADLCCVPSVPAGNGDLDGMPTVLAEAAASGLPLVGSNLAGIPLIIEPEHTGLLVPSGDVPALAQALDRLLGDELLRRRLGHNATAKARDFSWQTIAERFVAVYRAAIEARQAQPATTLRKVE
jgi:glycosyltransferase involved in cell wall biosynthesis